MGRPAKEVRMTIEFSEFFEKLGKENVLRKNILEIADLLKQNCPRGDSIPHDLWPKIYVKKYQITNLFRCELSGGWRLLYHIVGEQGGLVAYFLESLPHKEYDKRFGY